MFKIGEFSKITNVSVRMLRYYDENNLLKPAIINQSTGYRLYDKEQIEKLNKIIFLRDIGFNITEIKTLTENWNNTTIKNTLEQKKLEILKTIEMENLKLIRINSAVQDLDNYSIDQNIKVTIKSIPQYNVISVRKKITAYDKEGELWNELFGLIKQNNIQINDDSYSFTIFHDKEHMENNIDVEVCFVVNSLMKDNKNVHIKKTKAYDIAASFMVYGDYSNIGKACFKFASWISEHPAYKIYGESRQVCHVGCYDTDNKDEYLTEVIVPIYVMYIKKKTLTLTWC